MRFFGPSGRDDLGVINRIIRVVAFALLGIGGCALFLVAAQPDWGRVDWGDFPTWVSSVTTTLALVAAGIVVKIELDRDRVREEERQALGVKSEQADQADRVAAWFDPRDGLNLVRFRNATDLPVYDVVLTITPSGSSGFRAEFIPLIPPGLEDIQPPGPCSEFLRAHSEHLGAEAKDAYLRRTHVVIEFRDAAERRWRRNANGTLEAVPPVIFGTLDTRLDSVQVSMYGTYTPPSGS